VFVKLQRMDGGAKVKLRAPSVRSGFSGLSSGLDARYGLCGPQSEVSPARVGVAVQVRTADLQAATATITSSGRAGVTTDPPKTTMLISVRRAVPLPWGWRCR